MDVHSELSMLTDTELKVMAVLHMLSAYSGSFGYGNFYFTHDNIEGGEGKIFGTQWHDEIGDRKNISKILKKLREKGLVNFRRGLMTEDGEVAGSGNAPDQSVEELMQQVVEERSWE